MIRINPAESTPTTSQISEIVEMSVSLTSGCITAPQRELCSRMLTLTLKSGKIYRGRSIGKIVDRVHQYPYNQQVSRAYYFQICSNEF